MEKPLSPTSSLYLQLPEENTADRAEMTYRDSVVLLRRHLNRECQGQVDCAHLGLGRV